MLIKTQVVVLFSAKLTYDSPALTQSLRSPLINPLDTFFASLVVWLVVVLLCPLLSLGGKIRPSLCPISPPVLDSPVRSAPLPLRQLPQTAAEDQTLQSRSSSRSLWRARSAHHRGVLASPSPLSLRHHRHVGLRTWYLFTVKGVLPSPPVMYL